MLALHQHVHCAGWISRILTINSEPRRASSQLRGYCGPCQTSHLTPLCRFECPAGPGAVRQRVDFSLLSPAGKDGRHSSRRLFAGRTRRHRTRKSSEQYGSAMPTCTRIESGFMHARVCRQDVQQKLCRSALSSSTNAEFATQSHHPVNQKDATASYDPPLS